MGGNGGNPATEAGSQGTPGVGVWQLCKILADAVEQDDGLANFDAAERDNEFLAAVTAHT